MISVLPQLQQGGESGSPASQGCGALSIVSNVYGGSLPSPPHPCRNHTFQGLSHPFFRDGELQTGQHPALPMGMSKAGAPAEGAEALAPW